VRALMTTLFLSMNWFWVRKVHQRVTEPHVKFYERQDFFTFWYIVSFVRIWSWNAWRSVVRKNSLLQTACALRRTATSFPGIRSGLHNFHWWACVKASGRHLEHLTGSSIAVLCVHFKCVVTKCQTPFKRQTDGRTLCLSRASILCGNKP